MEHRSDEAALARCPLPTRPLDAALRESEALLDLSSSGRDELGIDGERRIDVADAVRRLDAEQERAWAAAAARAQKRVGH